MSHPWTYWSFCPGFTCFSWLHAAIRSHNKTYLVYAAVYAIFLVLMMCGPSVAQTYGEDSIAFNIVMTFVDIAWIVGIVHTQWVKQSVSSSFPVDTNQSNAQAAAGVPAAQTAQLAPLPQHQSSTGPVREWRCRIDGRKYGPFTTSQLRQMAQSGIIKPTDEVFRDGATDWVRADRVKGLFPAPASANRSDPGGNQTGESVDLNNDPEEAIAALPGVGTILAKKAVSIRQSSGGFATVEAFAEALGLKPHMVERIRPLVKLGVRKLEVPPATKTRVVDF
ncbi:MAG TPA: GYF domain-containing protein [Bacillota bacterium]|nr:GYF domain-containing protein [Bacillota bacterium]HPQ03026.1 GYF domain-containing protein [Bacillota bacterium]